LPDQSSNIDIFVGHTTNFLLCWQAFDHGSAGMNTPELESTNRLRLAHAAATLQQRAEKAGNLPISVYDERPLRGGRSLGPTASQTIDLFWPKRMLRKISAPSSMADTGSFSIVVLSHVTEGLPHTGGW